MLAVFYEIHFEARRCEDRHGARASVVRKIGVNDDDVGIRAEANARTRSHRVQTSGGFARCLCDLFRNAAERLVEAVELEHRICANVDVNGGTHGGVRKDGSHFSCDLHDRCFLSTL